MGKYIVRRLLQMIPVIIGVDIPDLHHGVRAARRSGVRAMR